MTKPKRTEEDEWRRCAEHLATELVSRKKLGQPQPVETQLALAEFYRLQKQYMDKPR